jgi:hypothetical protein
MLEVTGKAPQPFPGMFTVAVQGNAGTESAGVKNCGRQKVDSRAGWSHPVLLSKFLRVHVRPAVLRRRNEQVNIHEGRCLLNTIASTAVVLSSPSHTYC